MNALLQPHHSGWKCLYALVFGLALSATAHADDHGKHNGDMTLDGAMQSMKQRQDSMKMSGDTDRDFAMMMRNHHLGGIDMAKAELAHGKDPKMKKMARQIIDQQKKEVADFDKWLEKQK